MRVNNNPYRTWAIELREMGFSLEHIGYMLLARGMVDMKTATSVDDIQMELGYGIVDTAVLRDTFFKD